MPKQKTKKAAAKRVFITKTGKLKKRRAFRSHNLAHKRNSRKRLLVKEFDLAPGDAKRIRKILAK